MDGITLVKSLNVKEMNTNMSACSTSSYSTTHDGIVNENAINMKTEKYNSSANSNAYHSNLFDDSSNFPSNNFDQKDCLSERLTALKELGVDISPDKDGGVLKLILQEGPGLTKPLNGDDIYVEYKRWLVDGIVVDESCEPYKFQYGREKLVPAWEFAIPTMSEGEVAMYLGKPDYCYGQDGLAPFIPPNATILFLIRLISCHGKDISTEEDGSIYKSILTEGEAYGMPNDGALCTVEIVGRFGKRTFENRVVTFNHGEGCEQEIVKGVEQGLLKFSRGEKARLIIKSNLVFGELGSEKLGIPPNSDLEYIVHLIDCVRVKDFWDMSPDEKLEQSKLDKMKGINYFKAGKMAMAIKFFNKVVEYLQFEELTAGCDCEMKKNLLLTCYLNLALSYLKEGEPFLAENVCSKALELDRNNEKALYRRGLAFLEMKNYKEAQIDLEKVLKLNPCNRDARTRVKLASNFALETSALQKERLKKLFN